MESKESRHPPLCAQGLCGLPVAWAGGHRYYQQKSMSGCGWKGEHSSLHF